MRLVHSAGSVAPPNCPSPTTGARRVDALRCEAELEPGQTFRLEGRIVSVETCECFDDTCPICVPLHELADAEGAPFFVAIVGAAAPEWTLGSLQQMTVEIQEPGDSPGHLAVVKWVD